MQMFFDFHHGPARTIWQLGPRRPLHKWPLLKSAPAQRASLSVCWSRPGALQKWINPSRCLLECTLLHGAQETCSMGCILAPPVEYDWMIRARRRCCLMWSYTDHLLAVFCRLFLSITFLSKLSDTLSNSASTLERFSWSATMNPRLKMLHDGAARVRHFQRRVIIFQCHTNDRA